MPTLVRFGDAARAVTRTSPFVGGGRAGKDGKRIYTGKGQIQQETLCEIGFGFATGAAVSSYCTGANEQPSCRARGPGSRLEDLPLPLRVVPRRQGSRRAGPQSHHRFVFPRRFRSRPLPPYQRRNPAIPHPPPPLPFPPTSPHPRL